MKVAVAGCLHGELNRVYDDISAHDAQHGDQKVDLLLVCGDFQSVRNEHDLQCMHVPPKFRRLGDFHEYYYGKRKAPILTLFIGGNHEASNYLSTLPYGGWVAPNIYFMGYSSVVNFAGLRIGAVSGIYKGYDAHLGHFERLPYDRSTVTSIYHTRDIDAFRLMQITATPTDPQPLDIVLSHDWPQNIHSCGNVGKLLRMKPHFRQDIEQNHLGNPLYQPLVNHLKPRFWFSAHLHVKFEALINHSPNITTRFLALDKPVRPHAYLEFIDIPQKAGISDPEEKVLSYDAEWLSILQKTNRLMSTDKHPNPKVPHIWINSYVVSDKDLESVKEIFNCDLSVPNNFKMTEPVLEDRDTDPQRLTNIPNPQTTLFCQKLQVLDPFPANDLTHRENIGGDTEPNGGKGDSRGEEVFESNKKFRSEADEALEAGTLFVIDKKGSHN